MSRPRQGRGPRRAKAAAFVVAVSISYAQLLYPRVNDVLKTRSVASVSRQSRQARKQRREQPQEAYDLIKVTTGLSTIENTKAAADLFGTMLESVRRRRARRLAEGKR
jgi:hypothetical protein